MTPRSFLPIISAEELKQIADEPELVLVDARAGVDAYERYAKEHLPGARFVNLEKDLSDITDNPAKGGRHPLPEPKRFGEVLGSLGIDTQSYVVVYDDKLGANPAARFWWMLRAAGHEHVQVLSGGLQSALKAGFQATTEISAIEPKGEYQVRDWAENTVNADDVEEALKHKQSIVVDVRENGRYTGELEPIDKIAGHIPGAVNIPFSSNMDAEGIFLPAAALNEKYTRALEPDKTHEIIVHCGSGVTACHTILAMDQAGLPMPKLYVGSWSEWSNSGRPVATGD
jgi:3-mercaptopyruvate sulfurtransferase SseA